MHRLKPLMLLFASLLLTGAGFGLDTPTSFGEVARVDTPILRIPFMKQPPKIDGAMSKGEWEDASALSGFWYDFAQAAFIYLAPMQTQLQVYAAYDKENLYIAYSSPVFPTNSWLRSRGRFPDVTHHPQYGLIWDDHVEIEFRPHADNAEGFRLGLFKWFVNPFDTASDLYWSQNGGEKRRWQSKAYIKNGVTGTRWILEMAIPLKTMVFGNYEGNKRDGKQIVTLPPPDGTAYRCWFTRGIGGNAAFFNVFDKHSWNTTKTKFIFDSTAPSFQINELGPIMEDIVDLKLTVKNHARRSQTVRLGFFVESDEGNIYSSYNAKEIEDGLVELKPGEVKKLRLRRPFPGISRNGNVLWFDVRAAGRPAKTLFRTRLIKFHHMDGGEILKGETMVSFMDRRVNIIKTLRPPRRDFDFSFYWSAYTKKIQGIADIGIHGAGKDAKKAVAAKLIVMRDDEDSTEIAQQTVPFNGDFACFLLDVPKLTHGQTYMVSLLLFDKNKRIVGERNPEPFKFEQWEWLNNKKGLSDVVWEPFTPIKVTPGGFETLKHKFTVAPSGLPAQIYIKPDPRDLPLEVRGAAKHGLTDARLLALGRGPQLRRPIRLVAEVNGKEVPATVVQPAKVVRQWKSEIVYEARLKVGPLDVKVQSQYDCDGAWYCKLTYSGKDAAVQGFDMVMDVAGAVDVKATGTKGGGMAGADVWECGLPMKKGVVWDSADEERPDLFYTQFVPWLWFGSGDRAFTYFCDSDQNWIIDRDGSTMHMERDAKLQFSWRTKFINHTATVNGSRTIAFAVLTHPAKPKPKKWRHQAWYWRGGNWADEYFGGDFKKEESALIAKRDAMIKYCDGVDPATMSAEEKKNWSPKGPLYWRYYQNRGIGNVPASIKWSMSKEEWEKKKWDMGQRPGRGLGQYFEDKIAYWFERHVRIGRRHGWWWDETWPTYRSNKIAEGEAYLRDPKDVGDNELPWQDGFYTHHMRMAFKRLARIMAENKVANRNFFWANNEGTTFESFGFDTAMVEECGGGHRTFEVDMLQQFPNTLWRRMSHNWTGLVPRIMPQSTDGVGIGDDPRLDRQYLGIALLHDVGLIMSGPHGQIDHKEEIVPNLHRLTEFGFFKDDGKVEKIPFWRTRDIVHFEEDKTKAAADSVLDTLAGDVEITVYRRPLDDGRKGYKAIFVILNERDEDIELPLRLANVKRLLGGPNTLKAGAVRREAKVAAGLEGWWQGVAARNPEATVLKDFETGDIVAGSNKNSERYGPVYVGRHELRILYAEHAEQAGGDR